VLGLLDFTAAYVGIASAKDRERAGS
jgi:hypothetical protein